MLRSLLRDLIPELILSQKLQIHMGPIRNGSGVMNFLMFLKIRKERRTLCIYLAMLLNVQLQIRRSTLQQIVRSVLRLLGCIL